MLYLAQWQGSGTRIDPRRPTNIDQFVGRPWAALDLRPDPLSLDGFCVVSVPGVSPVVAGWLKLGEDPDEDTSGGAVRTILLNRLSLNFSVATPRLRNLFEQLMFDGTRKWKGVIANRQGVKRLYIAGQELAFRQVTPPVADELIDPTDTFTRADENPATGWTQTGSALRVIGNRLANASGGGNDAMGYYTAYTPAADHYSEFTYGTLSNGDASSCVRMAAANMACYALNGYTGAPQLYKVDSGGGFTSIAGGLTGFGSVHDGTVLRLSAVGSSLSGLVDGGAIGGGMPHTDTSYTTGRAGVHIYDGLVRLSQWTGADIGGSGPTTYPFTASGGTTTSGAAAKTLGKKMNAGGGAIVSGHALMKLAKRFAPSGGVVTTGAAPYVVGLRRTASGGVVTTGVAPSLLKKIVVAVGGLSVAGHAASLLGFRWTATGGVVTGGSAVATPPGNKFFASGGVATGGVAPYIVGLRRQASGGVASGGSSLIWLVKKVLASGGVVAGGHAAEKILRAWQAQGGVVSGGAATIGAQGSFTFVTSGGVTLGGQAFAFIGYRPSLLFGGVSTSGAALYRLMRSWRASGGVASGGAAEILYHSTNEPLGPLMPLYPGVDALPLLADPRGRYRKLSTDEERSDQIVLAELLLDLNAPPFSGEAGQRIQYGIALQVQFQLEQGLTPQIVESQSNQVPGNVTSYRMRWLHPGAAQIVRAASGRKTVGFGSTPLGV